MRIPAKGAIGQWGSHGVWSDAQATTCSGGSTRACAATEPQSLGSPPSGDVASEGGAVAAGGLPPAPSNHSCAHIGKYRKSDNGSHHVLGSAWPGLNHIDPISFGLAGTSGWKLMSTCTSSARGGPRSFQPSVSDLNPCPAPHAAHSPRDPFNPALYAVRGWRHRWAAAQAAAPDSDPSGTWLKPRAARRRRGGGAAAARRRRGDLRRRGCCRC